MLHNYFSIFIFFLILFILGIILVIGNKFFFFVEKSKYPNTSDLKEKSSAFECGFEPFSSARIQFNIRFYLFAILFIIFDVEVAFFFPWALVLKKLPFSGFIGMIIFLLFLFIGFVYEWGKGALEWE